MLSGICNLNAACLTWHGTKVPKPYCFNIEKVVYYSKEKKQIISQDVSNKTAVDGKCNVLRLEQEKSNGIIVYSSVWGYGSSSKPKIYLNYTRAVKIDKYPIADNNKIVRAYMYVFFIPLNDNNKLKGKIILKNFNKIKDILYINK